MDPRARKPVWCQVLFRHFATLPEHYQLAYDLSTAPRGVNRLPEGDFENPQAMLAAGWKHHAHPQSNVRTGVDWSAKAAHWGRTGLRLWAAPDDPKNRPRLIETPPGVLARFLAKRSGIALGRLAATCADPATIVQNSCPA